MIICDTREQFRANFRNFMETHGIEHHETCLNSRYYTDYIIVENGNGIGVQRKTTGEVIAEMVDIRTRIFDILSIWGHAVLLVEEDFDISDTGMVMIGMKDYFVETSFPVKNYYNFLQSLRNDGITVVCTKNYLQSLWWMYSTHERMKKVHPPMIRIDRHTPVEHATGILKILTGFGEKTIHSALSRATIREMISMDDAGLKSIGMNKTQRMSFSEAMDAKIPGEADPEKSCVCESCPHGFACEECTEDLRPTSPVTSTPSLLTS